MLPRAAFTLTALLVGCSAPAEIGSTSAALRIAPDDEAALRREIAVRGHAVALVALRDDPAALARPVDAVRMRLVAHTATAFVASVDPRHLTVRYRFLTFPGAVVVVDDVGLGALLAHSMVAAIGADFAGDATLAESVPLIRADQLQALGRSGGGVGVGILDTGINTGHLDFAGALLGTGFHSLRQGSDVGPGGIEDDTGHGSNVAGIIASRGVVSHVGVAPQAMLFIAKVLTPQGGDASDWAIAVDYITAHRGDFAVPIRVINMSLNTFKTDGRCRCDDGLVVWSKSTAAARASGIILFAATGNSGLPDAVGYPACFSSVFPIGATYDAAYGRSPRMGDYQTNYGAEFAACFDDSAPRRLTCFTNRFPCLALVAPGAAITAPYLGAPNALGTYYGTSQASPHAAGVAAQLVGGYPSLAPAQIADALLASQQPPVADPSLGVSYRFLDAIDADRMARCFATCAGGVCDGFGQCSLGGPPDLALASTTLPTNLPGPSCAVAGRGGRGGFAALALALAFAALRRRRRPGNT